MINPKEQDAISAQAIADAVDGLNEVQRFVMPTPGNLATPEQYNRIIQSHLMEIVGRFVGRIATLEDEIAEMKGRVAKIDNGLQRIYDERS